MKNLTGLLQSNINLLKIMPDKFKATWVSHSSISDFLKCPRLYYLRHVYKDPKTKHRITVMTPHLALGQAVHETIESLSLLPAEERFKSSLLDTYDENWKKVEGKKGGFKTKKEETEFKEKGREMIKKIIENPGPLTNKALKIKGPDEGFDLPYYWLNEEENIILSGKVDWVEYLEDSDGIHIIDFKTGKNEEDENSLQLPIYYLLSKNLQKRKIDKISYWYLSNGLGLVEMKLPDEKESYDKVYEVAKRMKLGKLIEHLKCPTDGCFACLPLEAVVNGKGEFVGTNGWQDIYIIN